MKSNENDLYISVIISSHDVSAPDISIDAAPARHTAMETARIALAPRLDWHQETDEFVQKTTKFIEFPFGLRQELRRFWMLLLWF